MEKKLTKPHSSGSLTMLEYISSHLIAVIGHELWNPLSAIQVGLESLANDLAMESESKQVIMETAMDNIRYLHQLIEGCVEFSQVERVGADSCLILNTTSQEVLRQTMVRLIESDAIKSKPQSNPEILSYFVNQEEVLEHIQQNLIAIVGHEIRTPLCTIEVCLESLINEPDMPSEYRQQMLAIALGDITRLQRLIEDFFMLDRLGKGQVYYRSGTVTLKEAIELAVTNLKTGRNLQLSNAIEIEIPQQLPLIRVDEDILVHALVKILDNACKFTPPSGKIKIKAQVKEQVTGDRHFSESTANEMLEIIISDNGRGIVPHNLEAIFNCFYQEENFLRRTVNGTGIGLTICRHIINALGGKIWAKSQGKGYGSSIHLTLPLCVNL